MNYIFDRASEVRVPHEPHHRPAHHDVFEGPDELSRRLQTAFDASMAGVTDLPRLVKLLYHASLIPDEGRYPRFRVLCGGETFGHTVEFAEPSPNVNSVESIRRLVPAISDPNIAVRIVEDVNHNFRAKQIIDFREHSARGDAEAISEASLPDGTLTIRVDGPGELRAAIQPGPIFHLRGNRVRELVAFDKSILPFRKLVEGLCRSVHGSVCSTAAAAHLTPELLTDIFLYVWATMMADVINRRHGGAFLILPQSDCPYVRPRFLANGNLFHAFTSTMSTLIERVGENLSEGSKLWLLHREHLLRLARMHGQLSATDGAVVFDCGLRLLGFGAKITGTNLTLPIQNVITGQLADEEAFGGMRHRSAAELVRSTAGAIAFVISQDGDLSAFYSDESSAYWLPNLDAWGTVSDLF